MRLIDADKLREELIKMIDDNVDTDTGVSCDNWVVDMSNDIVGKCIDILDKKQTVSKWIPTSKHLPLERFDIVHGEPFQFIMQLKGFMPTAGYIDNDGDWFFDEYMRNPAYNVVAWQPLPSRYKETSNE